MPIEPDRIKQYNKHKSAKEADYVTLLMNWFFEKCGYMFDITHPVTFNEKIQWMKIFGNLEQHTSLTDKLAVRKHIESKIGEKYLVPLLGVWDSFTDINFSKLPDKFMLKCNHGCEMNAVITADITHNLHPIAQDFVEWQGINFAFFNGFEMQYKNIPHKIFAEQYVENQENNLDDYKVWCFNGEPMYIMYMTSRNKKLQEFLFDIHWQPQHFITHNEKKLIPIAKPQNIGEIIDVARTLSKNIPFVRIDLYRLNNGDIKFGEMTFTPASGTFRWRPTEWDKILGDLLVLPAKSNSR